MRLHLCVYLQVEEYLKDQGELWCDDLCGAVIKSKEKEMSILDINANMSWWKTCGVTASGPTRSCTDAEKTAALAEIEKEEIQESSYCAVLGIYTPTHTPTHTHTHMIYIYICAYACMHACVYVCVCVWWCVHI
jgi:hypothetical protein